MGWKVHHTRPARTDKGWRTPLQGDAGYPDLTMARRGRVVIAELKSESGRVTREQAAWLEHLSARVVKEYDPSNMTWHHHHDGDDRIIFCRADGTECIEEYDGLVCDGLVRDEATLTWGPCKWHLANADVDAPPLEVYLWRPRDWERIKEVLA